MKTLFLKTRYKEAVRLKPSDIDKLPEKIALATTIQYIDSIEGIKKELENSGKKVIVLQGEHSSMKGQILGCDITRGIMEKLKRKNFDAFLFIGDGMFHAKLLIFVQKDKKKDVFIYNPLSKNFGKIKESEAKDIEKKYKAALTKYLSSDNIGIIVSTKPGQMRLKKALEIKKNLKDKGKNAYVFICNTLDFGELENFNFIECYVNTMCPRINYDDYLKFNKPVISYEDIEDG